MTALFTLTRQRGAACHRRTIAERRWMSASSKAEAERWLDRITTEARRIAVLNQMIAEAKAEAAKLDFVI